ncbi:hypothetical protein Tco_0392659, partial [Tanacetum coccineum]
RNLQRSIKQSFLDRIFPDRVSNAVKKVKGVDLLKLLTTDELWFRISDHDAVRVGILTHGIFILEILPNSKYWWKKDPTVIPHGISWSIIENFHKGDYSRFFAQCSNPILAFGPSDYESVQPWCVRSFEYISNLDEPRPRDCVGDVLVEVVELEHKLICSGGDTAEEQMQVDSNNHSDVHAEDQDLPYPNMDKDANIHSDVLVKDQNSPIMDKEDLLAEFDVKDKIAVLEKALKLRYQDSSGDSLQQVCYKQHELGGSKILKTSSPFRSYSNEKYGPVVDCTQLEGSVGFDNMLDPGCKDKLADDNDQEGLVKLVDKLSMEEHILANILDEKMVDEKGQASPRLNATEGEKMVSLDLNCVNMNVPRCSEQVFRRLQRITLAESSQEMSGKRKLTGGEKEADRSVDFPILHEMTVDPWVESITGSCVDRDFWLTLFGCSNSGWLSDKHLDIWCDLMWNFRQPDAD